MLCVNVTETQILIQDLCLGGASRGRGALRQLLRQFQQVLTWRRVPIFRLLGEGGRGRDLDGCTGQAANSTGRPPDALTIGARINPLASASCSLMAASFQ